MEPEEDFSSEVLEDFIKLYKSGNLDLFIQSSCNYNI